MSPAPDGKQNHRPGPTLTPITNGTIWWHKALPAIERLGLENLSTTRPQKKPVSNAARSAQNSDAPFVKKGRNPRRNCTSIKSCSSSDKNCRRSNLLRVVNPTMMVDAIVLKKWLRGQRNHFEIKMQPRPGLGFRVQWVSSGSPFRDRFWAGVRADQTPAPSPSCPAGEWTPETSPTLGPEALSSKRKWAICGSTTHVAALRCCPKSGRGRLMWDQLEAIWAQTRPKSARPNLGQFQKRQPYPGIFELSGTYPVCC
jgi:hypothetical protein